MSPIKPEHIYNLIEVSAVEIAADGSAVVFVRQEISKETMKRESRIVVQSLESGDAVDMATGDTAPRLSADGKSLAFLRSGEDDKKQVWVMPVNGGDARQVTALPDGAKDMAWSPDGSAFVVVSRVDPDRVEDGEEKVPRTQVARRVRYRDDEGGWRGDAFSQLFLVDAVTGEAEQITDGEGDQGAPAWSPDGSRIAFVTDCVEGRDFMRGSEVHVMDKASGRSQCWCAGVEPRGVCGVVAGWRAAGGCGRRTMGMCGIQGSRGCLCWRKTKHRCVWRVIFIRLCNLLRRGAGRRGMGYCLLVIGRVSRFCVG